MDIFSRGSTVIQHAALPFLRPPTHDTAQINFEEETNRYDTLLEGIDNNDRMFHKFLTGGI
jgi:hypothetical protein